MRIGRRKLLAGAAAAWAVRGHAADGGTIVRLDPELDTLIDRDAAIEVIARGYRWSEGPVWVARGGFLLFSDVPANVVHRWQRGEGARPFLSPSGLQGPIPAGVREAGANGLAIDARGALVMADSGTRAIVRVDLASRRRTVLAERIGGKRFNSCNDLAIARDGTIYFTDPPYGLEEGDASPLKELAINGVYRLRPGGKPELIDGTLRRPNGVALSPREDRLYVGCSDEAAPEVRVYALGPGAAPMQGRRFADFAAELARGWPGLPDGLKVARTGHVFATGPGGLWVLAPDGRRLGRISTGAAISNCAFGEGGRALFLTSGDRVARLPLRRPLA